MNEPEKDEDGNYADERAAICPSCGYQFGRWSGDPESPQMPEEHTEHVANCPGRFHVWSPDGKGWTQPRDVIKEDGSKVSDTNPLKPGEVWHFA